jgi:hypothetical protein
MDLRIEIGDHKRPAVFGSSSPQAPIIVVSFELRKRVSGESRSSGALDGSFAK